MLMIIVFIVALLLGVPIALVLGLVSFAELITMGPEFLIALPQRVFATSNSNSLMAIPLFIVFGELLELSGDIGRLADFSRALIGRVRGGLAYVTLILGFLLGGPLGTANAQAALMGSSFHPELVKNGYDEEFSAGFIATISCVGPLIPPGILFVIYGVASDTSIADLFMAGVMPGIYLLLVLAVVVFFEGRKAKWPVTQWLGWKNVWNTFVKASFSLFIPIFTIGIIMFGVATPTESAAVATVLTFLVGTFVYKTIKLKDLKPLLIKSAIASGAIMLIASMGGVLSWTLALERIPQQVADFIVGFTNNKFVVLLLIQALLFIVGMVMDASPAILILVPVLMPIINLYGFDPVHFGMLMCFNLTVGLLTPPVGTVLYTTAAATKIPVDRMVQTIWKWVIVCIAVLMFVAYVPQLTMWLPNMLKK